MPSPKAFLVDELENIERCLKEALRHEYGADQGLGFFEECRERLEALGLATASTDERDLVRLKELSNQINLLSALIGRIERSHRGEFSWAFAQEIQRMGKDICRDSTGRDSAENLFYFGSDGGLGAYRIYPEQHTIHLASARIFSVIFPRTLKHHVLLHPILAHELGHAGLAVPEVHNRALGALQVLNRSPVLVDRVAFRGWLTNIGVTPPTDDAAIDEVIVSWLTEFFCDLFGLLTFGPSFVGAQTTLLTALDPSGMQLGNSHPPSKCRFRLISVALDHLGWTSYCDDILRELRNDSEVMWPSLLDPSLFVPAIEVVSDQEVRNAIDMLVADPTQFGGSVFRLPDKAEVLELAQQLLRRIPPLPIQSFEANSVSLLVPDFRTILLAGWLAWRTIEGGSQANPISFFDVNRLCDHAILQSQAVGLQVKRNQESAVAP